MKKIVTILLLLLIISSTILPDQKQKLGLVLSGGGIKGFGHLGTLYMIDSLNIPIDFVAGTSIGAISAALYATGHSAYEIDKIASETKWEEIFGQSRKRNELYYFQKQDNAKFQLNFSLHGFTPISPISLSNGQYSYEHLLDLFSEYVNVESYDNLVIPFRCNATDIITGEEIIFNRGSIPKALRVSTSIPTIFSPIEYNNKLLVDGGLINNLPVNLVEDLGAEYIIASSLTSQKKTKNEIIDVFNIVEKIIDLYGDENEYTNSLKADILITPELSDISSIGFNIKDIETIKLKGKRAAYYNINKFLYLKNKDADLINLASIIEDTIRIDSLILSKDMQEDLLIKNIFDSKNRLSKNQITNKILTIRKSQIYHSIYSKYKKNIDNQSYTLYLYGIKNKPIFINEIEVVGNKKISEEEILSMLSLNRNQELNTKIFNDNIKKIYNTERFEYINYDIMNIDDKKSKLILNIKESENKRLKLGAVWDNYYKLIGKIKLDIFNKPFKKFRLQNELLFSGIKQNRLTLYYLLSRNNKINLIPFIEFTNRIKNIGIYYIPDNQMNYITHDFKETSLGLIYPISKFGSISISHNISSSKLNLSESVWDVVSFTNNHKKYTKIKLKIDQIDDLLHPKNGYKINIIYQHSPDNYTTINNNCTNNGMPCSPWEDENGYKYLYSEIDYYKTCNYNHTLRVFSQYKSNSSSGTYNGMPLYLMSTYGGSNLAVGYDEHILTAKKLSLVGIEYQYHFKNSLTYRVILNWVGKIDYENGPINYGVGVRIKSLIGPLDFTWGRGHSEPFNKNSKEINIFYFNFGVAL